MYSRVSGDKCHGEQRGKGIGRGSVGWVIKIEIERSGKTLLRRWHLNRELALYMYWGKTPSFGEKNCLCQGLEMGPCRVSWWNIEEAHVAEAVMEGESGRRWGQGGDGGQVTQGLWVEVRTLVSSLSEMGVPGSFWVYFCYNCPSFPPHSILWCVRLSENK